MPSAGRNLEQQTLSSYPPRPPRRVVGDDQAPVLRALLARTEGSLPSSRRLPWPHLSSEHNLSRRTIRPAAELRCGLQTDPRAYCSSGWATSAAPRSSPARLGKVRRRVILGPSPLLSRHSLWQ